MNHQQKKETGKSAPSMTLRVYREDDCDRILQLFYDTVHQVNRKDYTPEQLDAWAPKQWDRERWAQSLAEHASFVAEIEGKLAGFADLEGSAHFDRLYVSHRYQRMGVATKLCDQVEETARQKGAGTICVEASITAKPFFEKRGYRLLCRQEVERKGVRLINFRMEKKL